VKIAFHNVYKEINKNNFLFESLNTSLGDELLLPFHHLKNVAALRGIDCATTDIYGVDELDVCVFIDYPQDEKIINNLVSLNKKIYLIMFESKLINKKNWDLGNHKAFNKVFTWCDDIVDNVKYFKINFAQKGTQDFSPIDFKNKKLVTLIASNKLENSAGELYSKRIEVIRYFEQKHPELFDLYGIGWDYYRFSGKLRFLNIINKLPYKLKRITNKYKSYRGPLKNKRAKLSEYKYSICFENFTGVNGYITEKIFDCFLAGVVPIYWGADNIEDHIPKNCYIDYRNFKNNDEMLNHILNISESEYDTYLKNIKNYLNSDSFYPFSLGCFAETLLRDL